MVQLKKLEKIRTNQTQIWQVEKRIKIRAEINEIEVKKTRQRINDCKSWLLEKLNKINRTLAPLTKRKKEKTKNNQNQT